MDQWKFVTAAVTVFAFSLEIRPMDSFLTAYLTGPEVNATLDEVKIIERDVKRHTREGGSAGGTFSGECPDIIIPVDTLD